MANPWKNRVLAYNKTVAEQAEKALELGVVFEELLQLPPGQAKKVLTPKVLEVLAKYGYVVE